MHEVIRAEIISAVQARLQAYITIRAGIIHVDTEANHLAAVFVSVIYASVQRLGETTVSKVGGGVNRTLYSRAELSL